MIKKQLLCFFVIGILASLLSGAGFLEDPSVIRVDNVVLGKETEIIGLKADGGYFLNIKNTDNTPAVYRIEIISCKAYGSKPQPGYLDIPEKELKKWIKIREKLLKVEAGRTGYVRGVSVKIPKKKEYIGKNFQAIVKVVKEAIPGQSVNLEIVLPLWIRTASARK